MRNTSDMLPEELPDPIELPIEPAPILCMEAFPADVPCAVVWGLLPIPPILSILFPVATGGVVTVLITVAVVGVGALAEGAE